MAGRSKRSAAHCRTLQSFVDNSQWTLPACSMQHWTALPVLIHSTHLTEWHIVGRRGGLPASLKTPKCHQQALGRSVPPAFRSNLGVLQRARTLLSEHLELARYLSLSYVVFFEQQTFSKCCSHTAGLADSRSALVARRESHPAASTSRKLVNKLGNLSIID